MEHIADQFLRLLAWNSGVSHEVSLPVIKKRAVMDFVVCKSSSPVITTLYGMGKTLLSSPWSQNKGYTLPFSKINPVYLLHAKEFPMCTQTTQVWLSLIVHLTRSIVLLSGLWLPTFFFPTYVKYQGCHLSEIECAKEQYEFFWIKITDESKMNRYVCTRSGLWDNFEPKRHFTSLPFHKHEFNWKVIYLSSVRGSNKRLSPWGHTLAQTISENTSTADWCCMAVQWWYESSWEDEVSKLPQKPLFFCIEIAKAGVKCMQ